MGRFLKLSALYAGASAFYFFIDDGFWEALREVVPGFLVALIYFALGPIVLLDFAGPVSIFPYIIATLATLFLFSSWGKTGETKYLLAMGLLWALSLFGHSLLMGAISGSPPAMV